MYVQSLAFLKRGQALSHITEHYFQMCSYTQTKAAFYVIEFLSSLTGRKTSSRDVQITCYLMVKSNIKSYMYRY